MPDRDDLLLLSHSHGHCRYLNLQLPYEDSALTLSHLNLHYKHHANENQCFVELKPK